MLTLARRLAAAAVLTVVSGVLAVPAATAGGTFGDTVEVATGDVSTPPSGGCVTPRFTVTNTQAGSVYAWAADVEVLDPYGALHDFVSYSGSDASHDFAGIDICDSRDVGGTFTVTVSWRLYDSGFNIVGSGTTTGYFDYTKQPKASCRIAVKKSAYGVNGWVFRGRMFRGGAPFANGKVDVQVRYAGSWYHLGPKKYTNRRGIAKWHTSRKIPRNRYVFRLRFKGNATTAACSSTAFRLPSR